jgi:hypothetical protein
MKTKNNPVFRNKLASKYYNYLRNNSSVYEAGVDDRGNLYFAFLNGNVDRYTRREFIKFATDFYTDSYND